MNHDNGVELSGEFSPFLRVCVGIALLVLALTPALYIVLRYA